MTVPDYTNAHNIYHSNNNWKTPSRRQNIIAKIEIIIQACGIQIQKTSNQIENDVFVQAKSRDEYMGTIARFIYHLMKKPHEPHPLLM